jgi:type VI secretion system secreted protein VgrG
MSDIRFTFESQGVGPNDKLNVVKIDGVEAISQLFRFDITLASNSKDLDYGALLKNTAKLTIKSQDGQTDVPYHGMLSEIEQLGKSNDFYFYKAVLVPRIWKMSLSHFNEVYLGDKTIPQIIEGVLNDNGFSAMDYEIAQKDPSVYRQRSFVTQYQESSFGFISRWMEQQGLYYYYDHSAGTDKLKITDFKESQPARSLNLSYCQPEDLQTANQDVCVYDFVCKQTQLPQKVIVQDYNYRKADLADGLKSEAFIDMMNGSGEIMYYGENLRDMGESGQLANVRAEEFKSRAKVFYGTATAVGLRSGNLFNLSDHYRSDMNTEYMVTHVQHRGSQAGVLAGTNTPYVDSSVGTTYECDFKAIPSSVQLRPARLTPRPTIAGTLTAVIDDEGSGKYAQLNEYGQYKVKLMYDLVEKSANKGSSWVRMASPYAGASNGMNFPLLKGTEVIIGFMGGDPDQPVIMAAVTNSENKNVVDSENAPANIIKTPGNNLIGLNDVRGQEHIALSSVGGVIKIGMASDSD